MVQQTRWFEIGEPVDSDRVEAVVRTTYQTGPNTPSRPDDVERGTVDIDVVGLLDDHDEIAAHVHDDGSVLLSSLSAKSEEQLLDSFRTTGLDQIEQFIQRGCSPAEAVDYYMTEERGLSQTMWADRRGRTQQAIADNVRGARESLDQKIRFTDFDVEHPPEKGMLFKDTQYEDENAPIIEFKGQRKTTVASGRPDAPNADVLGARGDIPAGSVEKHKLKFKTHRPGGFWNKDEVNEIDEDMYDGRDRLILVDRHGHPILNDE